MAKVYVTQIPHRRDEATGAFVPTINIAPAQEHGELIVMMPARASFHATTDLVKQLRNHLVRYDYDAGDVLGALGDSSIIAIASGLLGQLHGKFSVLKWDRMLGRYVKTKINL